MSNKTIADLRTHLFTALDGLSNNSMDIERARAISDVAQTIINSAKVEVDFIKATGGEGSSFISGIEVGGLPQGVTVRTHRLR